MITLGPKQESNLRKNRSSLRALHRLKNLRKPFVFWNKGRTHLVFVLDAIN